MPLAEKTFLVVDDEPDILDAIQRLFRRQYRVLTAQTVEEAFELLEKESIQVVMTDQRMPHSSGVEFLRALRDRYPDVVRVLLTGYSNLDNVVDAINEGHVYRYISKPWNPSELKLFVAQAFEYYSAQRERDILVSELRAANEKLGLKNAQLTAANEELKMLDKMKTVFMEIVSHELNTPIAVLLGYAFLLNREIGESENRVVERAIDGIENAGNRLKNITGRIFKMMDSDEESRHFHLEDVEIDDFLHGIEREVAPFMRKRKQSLEIEIDGELGSIRADREKLDDVFINLVMNAVKFSYDEATIHLQATELSGDRIQICVIDQGIGITEEDLDQVFDAFFSTFDSRYHSSGEFEFGKRGIGLGLSVARKFTEMHGGSIDVASDEGEGTRFTVVLPRNPTSITRAETPKETPAQPSP